MRAGMMWSKLWSKLRPGRMGRVVALLAILAAALAQPEPALAQEMRVRFDATELPRGLLRSEVELAVPEPIRSGGGPLALWFPKWVPGAHGPAGSVEEVVWLSIRTGAGDTVRWRRTPGEVYRVVAEVPEGTRRLAVELRVAAGGGGAGTGVAAGPGIGVINPGAAIVYRERDSASSVDVGVSLVLPEGWHAATALEPVPGASRRSEIVYRPDTLRAVVDAPIVIGRHMRTYDLIGPDAPDGTPPHRLRMVSESPDGVDIHPDLLASYRAMVSEASALFGSHPFDSFDVLVASTDELGRTGLEHGRSTLNVLPPTVFDRPEINAWWDRLLIPHEYVHAWVGKYRRPAGMATGDYHTPKDTELLWVYEGLTQYLGQVLEARSGLMSRDEFVDALHDQVTGLRAQQGRQWRPLIDTALASRLLRSPSGPWAGLKRNQAYYFEGALFWLEADALIRRETGGARSLDDFCRVFFARGPGDPAVKSYSRRDVIGALERVHAHDWDRFFRERVERVTPELPMGAIAGMGYRFELAGEPQRAASGRPLGSPLAQPEGIGLVLIGDGQVRSVTLGSAADRAGLAPGMRIVGVGDLVFGAGAWRKAIERAQQTGGVPVTVRIGDRLERREIAYDGGLRYVRIERDPGREDVLGQILAPRRDVGRE